MAEYRRPVQNDFIRQAPKDRLWEDFETSKSVFGTSAALNFYNYGVTANLVNEAKIMQENGFSDYFLYGELQEDTELSPVLTVEEANSQGEKYGLQFDEPVRQSVLDLRMKSRRDELKRQSILARAPKTFSASAANISGGFFGALADPANIAASFIPIVREARYARMIQASGVARARIAKGAVEGTVGATLMEAPTLALTERAQADYDTYDSLMNIAFGGVMGGGLHFTGGYVKDKISNRIQRNAVPDRIERSSIETKEQAMRVGISDAIEGRAIDVEPVLRNDPNYEKDFNDPFDPRTWNNFDAQEPPPPRDYEASMKITPATQRYVDSVVDELLQSRKGELFFQEEDFQGSTPNIISHKGNVPEWFGQYNKQATEFNKYREKIKKQNQKLPEGSKREVPKTMPIMTRNKIDAVRNKMKNQETLGSQEKEIAAMIYDLAIEQRARNVRDMVEFREARSQAQKDYWEQKENGDYADFAQRKATSSDLVEEADLMPEPDFTRTAEVDDALESAMDDLSDYDNFFETVDDEILESFGITRKEIDAEFKMLDEEITEAEEFAKAIDAFAACMTRG